jgi:RHS repeat-associated protein
VRLRIGPPVPGDASPAVSFQVADHLGSVTATIDGTGAVFNREEYSPYGETTFGSFTHKRHRFTGCVRDEESGLSHHGARYYAPWLCRWTSCDPKGLVDGPNLYAYARGNPVGLTDRAGTASKPKDPPAKNERYTTQKYSDTTGGKNPKSTRTGGENLQFHHGTQAEWGEQNIAGYSRGDAPTQLLETGKGQEHTILSNMQEDARPLDASGKTHWDRKSTSQAFAESAEQYQAADLLKDEKHGLRFIHEDRGYLFSLNDKTVVNPETGKLEVIKNANLAEMEKIAKAKAPSAGGIMDTIVKPVAKFVGERGVKALPLAGAAWTLFGPGDARAAERVYRAVAGEFGLGPIDAELVFFDLAPVAFTAAKDLLNEAAAAAARNAPPDVVQGFQQLNPVSSGVFPGQAW